MAQIASMRHSPIPSSAPVSCGPADDESSVDSRPVPVLAARSDSSVSSAGSVPSMTPSVISTASSSSSTTTLPPFPLEFIDLELAAVNDDPELARHLDDCAYRPPSNVIPAESFSLEHEFDDDDWSASPSYVSMEDDDPLHPSFSLSALEINRNALFGLRPPAVDLNAVSIALTPDTAWPTVHPSDEKSLLVHTVKSVPPVIRALYGFRDKRLEFGDTSVMTTYHYIARLASPDSRLSDRGHLDGGAQASTTDQLDLLWNYEKFGANNPYRLRVADARPHQPVGSGFLRVPIVSSDTSSPTAFYEVECFYTPSMPTTIVSPTAMSKTHGCRGYSSVLLHDNSRCHIALHQCRRSARVEVPAENIEGLLYTLPLVRCTDSPTTPTSSVHPAVASLELADPIPLSLDALEERTVSVGTEERSSSMNNGIPSISSSALSGSPPGRARVSFDPSLPPTVCSCCCSSTSGSPDVTTVDTEPLDPFLPPTAPLSERLLWLSRLGFQPDVDLGLEPASAVDVDDPEALRDGFAARRPADPDKAEFFDYVVNALGSDDLRRLWHLRFGHTNFRRVSDMHHYADGVPKVPIGTFLDSCPICQQEKLTKAARTKTPTRSALVCNQGISIDFGFIVQASSTSGRAQQFTGFHGETCYCLITDHKSRRLYGECFASKAPPIDYLNRWLATHGLPKDYPDKYVRIDPGGDLGLSADVCNLFSNAGYRVEPIPPNASASNGPGERPHRTIGDALRSMLAGANLSPKFWPYAFHHYLRLYNVTVHGDDSASPITLCTGKKPDLSRLRVFGCRIYALPSRPRRPAKLQHDSRPGIFLGFCRTMRSALYYDLQTKEVKDSQHVAFDEAMHDLGVDKPPNARLLSRTSSGDLPDLLSDAFKLPVDVPDLEVQSCPFSDVTEVTLPFDPSAPLTSIGLDYRKCSRFLRAYISDVTVRPPAFRSLRAFKAKFLGAYIVRVGDQPVFTPEQIDTALTGLACSATPPSNITLSLAPERYVPQRNKLDPPLHLRLNDLRRISALQSVNRDGVSTTSFATSIEASMQDLDDVMADDMMQHVRRVLSSSPVSFDLHRLQNDFLTKEEAKLTSFTRRNLKKLSNWDVWDAAHDKQLDAHDAANVLGQPVLRSSLDDLTERHHVLRFQWSNLVKPASGVRKARCCLDGSKRAAPWLRTFAKTYASCISQPCMRLFLALAAVEGLQVTIGDVVNAFQSLNPPPTDLCFAEADDAYITWYERKTGIRLDPHKYVVPILRTIQGHPEAGALYEAEITKILVDELGFQPTTQEPNLLRGSIDGHLVLICRQVDDFAIATSDPATAEKLIARLNKYVTVESEGVGSKFNGIEIEQTRDYLRQHCTSYIERVLQSHGWEQPAARESDRHDSVPMRPEDSARLQALTGPVEGSPEHKLLAAEMKFGYRQLLGELLYAYLVCRLDIGYAVATLSRFSTQPHREHYIALRKICLYLRRTKHYGLMYWRPTDKRVSSLPHVPFDCVPVDATLGDFPHTPLHELVGFVDAAYGTDLTTRKSVTGIILCYAGAAIAFKSKLQATVSTSSTEAEFIAAVDAAKMVKYLRSVLAELGFPPAGPTVLHEDNQAAIEMINHSKPTARSRHVDIQHFAIQEWQRRGLVTMQYIPTSLNVSDAETKALSWTLLSRHVLRAMGHCGPS